MEAVVERAALGRRGGDHCYLAFTHIAPDGANTSTQPSEMQAQLVSVHRVMCCVRDLVNMVAPMWKKKTKKREKVKKTAQFR